MIMMQDCDYVQYSNNVVILVYNNIVLIGFNLFRVSNLTA